MTKVSKKLSAKKLFLSKREQGFIRGEWSFAQHAADLAKKNIQDYLTDVAFQRLGVPNGAKVKVAEDASYLEVVEGEPNA